MEIQKINYGYLIGGKKNDIVQNFKKPEYEEIGYGYDYDLTNNILIGNSKIAEYGFFSTFSLMFIALLNVYRKYNKSVNDIDGRFLLKHIKGEIPDMYKHFFSIDSEFQINFDSKKIDFPIDQNEHHTIYSEKKIFFYNQIFKKYFKLTPNIEYKIKFLTEKYNIISENSVSVVYRDTDKWTDFGGFNHISPAFYCRIARNIKTETPDIQVLIQTENEGVKKFLMEGLGAKSIEETLTSDKSIPLFLYLKEKKLEWAEYYVASLWIHAKSKYLITYTGNSGFFLYLIRGTTKNLYQEITFTKNNEMEFFVKDYEN